MPSRNIVAAKILIIRNQKSRASITEARLYCNLVEAKAKTDSLTPGAA